MSIYVDQIDLSMADPSTGEYLTANIYSVEGVKNPDGSLRQLSISQLVMAICLKNAADLETEIIALMETMNQTTAQLEAMTKIETDVLSRLVDLNNTYLVYEGQSMTYKAFLTNVMGMTNVPDTASASSNEFITELEAKMDEKNSFSQQTMIELQSQTNKRDQAYDMISNILKSFQTVLIGTVNNI